MPHLSKIYRTFLSNYLVLILVLSPFVTLAQSPFGTGTIKNKVLGALEDLSVLYASHSGDGTESYFTAPNTILTSYTYDMYVPASYDGSEPYGLVSWINSGNKGAVKFEAWKQVLDEKKLIWVGGDNIGNDIGTYTRMSVAWAGMLRAKEIFNIDESRIYSSGNSGGSRMATSLAYVYPEAFDAVLPQCGSAFPQWVDQDYETRDPNSHYERILSFSNSELEYIKSFDLKYGIMTSFGDFREGDIMNIYHNGMEPNDMKARFLEIDGNHCTTSAAHFRDAINFVEHSFLTNLHDDFETGTATIGDGFQENNVVTNTTDITLEPGEGIAQLKSQNLFFWNDPKGSIAEFLVSPDRNANDKNTLFTFGVHAFESVDQYCGTSSDNEDVVVPSIKLELDFSEDQPLVKVVLTNPTEADSLITALDGSLNDWVSGDELKVKIHIWDQELRIEFSNHLNKSATAIGGVKLLDDLRSIRVRWEELVPDSVFWEPAHWENGSFITMDAQRVDPLAEGGGLTVDYIEWISDVEAGSVDLPVLEIIHGETELIAEDGHANYQWYVNELGTTQGKVLSEVNEFDEVYVTANHSNGCFVSSDKVNFVISASSFQQLQNHIYPNPTSGMINFTSNDDWVISTILGEVLLKGSSFEVDVSSFENGIYIVEQGSDIMRLVKE